jgi:uncharacterized protein
MHRAVAIAGLLFVATLSHAEPSIESAVAAYERGNLRRARVEFLRLSAQGVAAADYNLAVMHLRHELPHADQREAVRLMGRAADAGFVTAMVGLADLYEHGRAGLKIDLEHAVRWQRRAAEAGGADAQVALATAYYLGRGVPRDAAAAAHWYRVAAQAGDVGAMYLFASMAESGDGLPRDLAEARYWYAAAARSGDEAAPGKVRELDARLGRPGP